MLKKRTNGVVTAPRLSKSLAGPKDVAVNRRSFLKGSGLAAGGIAAAATLNFGMVKKAEAQSQTGAAKNSRK